MSENAILLIQQAESRAEEIRKNASREANAIIATANERGLSLLRESEAKADRAGKEKIESLRSKTNELIKKSESDAMTEAEKLKAKSQMRTHIAVKQIIRGIMEQCQ